MLARKTICSLRHAGHASLVLCKHVSTTTARPQQATHRNLPADFQYFPAFFSVREQSALLSAALRKLDATESRQFRRRRKELEQKSAFSFSSERPSSVQALFLPDEYYDFQEGHYDGVIKRYREMHILPWPPDIEGLSPALERLRAVYLSADVQTHLLHLASDGEILPHVDNVGASGSWILGVSLGAPRILKLENTRNPEEAYTLTLPSGSVYIQKDTTRYHFKHSILLNGLFDGKQYNDGQRMSIMVRDRFKETGGYMNPLIALSGDA